MAGQAHITSIDALESFRASLVVYLSKARPTLEEISSDVLRIRLWLENEQRTCWESQVRRRSQLLEEAQQALFSARLLDPRASADAQQMAVRRARRALEEAEAKLRRVKKWTRDFDSRIEPLEKQLDHLQSLLAIDMLGAVADLGQTIQWLADYAGLSRIPASAGPATPPQAAPVHNQPADPLVDKVSTESSRPSANRREEP